MSEVYDAIFRTAILAPDDIQTLAAVGALRRKIKANKVDPHALRLKVGPDDVLMRAYLEARKVAEEELSVANIELFEMKQRLAKAEAEIEELRVRERPPLRNLTVTEYVSRMSYTPSQAEAEKLRIDEARQAGNLNLMQASKHKAWVTRRTIKEGV